MVNCWYCHEPREIGDGHMYQCVNRIVREDRMKKAMAEAMTVDLETPCTVEQCGVIFKGQFSKIVVESVIHFEKYHKEEI